MNEQDRWRRIERVFNEAVERDASEWPAFLAEACGGDAGLRREVEALLRHHTRTGDLFEGSRELAEALVRESAASWVEGRSVGPYRLEREIGSGGMGRVFLAEREDLPKRVALKLVREPLASPDRIQRFRHEQRVLAGLEHPHIAQLLDAGVTDDGAPWCAMEYVDGENISGFCDRMRLGVDQRLRLFLCVCDAVRYAHANLVVHRDIKPSNILVTHDGRPKLLDFGVAKLLDPAEDAALTRTGVRAFTPAYAAPEQLTGERISTATDVYQLGGLLYELLAGRPPFDLANRSPAEAERIVRERAPVPPSSAVTREAARTRPDGSVDRLSPADVGAMRSTTPERLRRRLAGDLENIVLKALEKEPERRYPSVDALAGDIERFLDGRPVLARPASAAYRAKKFLLRHKAAAAVALLVVGYAVTATWSAASIARERGRAERKAAAATRVSDFLVDVFTRADPNDTVPGQATALELVNRGAERVNQELAGQPEIQAAMQEVLGNVYHELGREAEAEPLLRASLATRLRLLGEGSLEVASARHYLAQVLWSNGDLEGADTLNRKALEMRRRLLDESDERLWGTLNNLGTVRQLEGRLEEAARMYTEAIRMVRASYPDGHIRLGTYLNNLANVRHAQGDLASARSLMREALESDRRFFPADNPGIAIRLDNLAFMAYSAGDFEDALETAKEALAMYWRVYGAPHPDMPYAMTTIAKASAGLGDTAFADSMHLAALDMRRSLLGPDHDNLYMSYTGLGQHMFATGRAAEAESYFQEALRIARKTRGEEHAWVAQSLWNLGRVRERLGDPEQAEELMRQGYALLLAAVGEAHPSVVEKREYLTDFLRRTGQAQEAEALELAGFRADSAAESN
ncbi:MAG TPA: serine/threonine-protein kinase [Longimicrobiales bacterium]